MENISDALKMAGAALLFVIALTVTIMLFSQARETAQIVLYSRDNTNYYQKLNPTNNGVTRVVGIETVIPTLYRYQQEGIVIRIIASDGTEIQAFDWNAEQIVNRYGGRNSDYYNNSDQYTAEEKENIVPILEKYNENSNAFNYMFGAPWTTGDTSNTKVVERINAFIYGLKVDSLGLDYTGDRENLMYYYKHYKSQDKKLTFEESYVEYNISGRYKHDGFGNWYTIVDGEQKVIITYTIQD